MLILPFMSCSARLPVYILIIGAFFPSWQGTVLFLIYLTGIMLAAISALVLKRFLIKGDDVPFVMELPPYRIPTLRNTLRHMWNQSYEYLKRISGIILLASVIVWGLNYYPQNSRILSDLHALKTSSNFNSGIVIEINNASYLERFGKTIEPVMSPLGFDWKMSVSLLAGIPGKEIVVSTMAVLYQSDDKDNQYETLNDSLINERYKSGLKKGQLVYNPLTALTFLLFILIYFPCVAVVAVVAKESGSVKWAAFLIFYTTTLAYILSFIFYQIGNYLTG
jgi:ferrous iron transport protein B